MKSKIRDSFCAATVGAALAVALCRPTAQADSTPQPLPLVQNWTDTNLIGADNDWSKVPGFVGFRGDKLTSRPGVNPQTITSDGTVTPVDVIANQGKPNSLRTGGVAEFDGIPDPVIALKGSATAAAPFLLLNLSTKGKKNIAFGYKLRDLDNSVNNAVQPVAFQYRVGTNTDFTNLPAGSAADASTGPNLATQTTSMVVLLPAEANDQPHVQVRWITANAEGNDEWIGIAAITAIGDDLAPPATNPAAPATTKTDTNPAPKPLRTPRDAANP